MKKVLFNITVYSMLAWSVFSAAYIALPPEIQAMLPQMNWITAVVSGGSTALLGTGGMLVQSWLSRARVQSDEKYNMLGQKFLTLVDSYKDVAAKYDTLRSEVAYNNQLLSAELRTKLSNPLLTDTARALITEVLTHENQE